MLTRRILLILYVRSQKDQYADYTTLYRFTKSNPKGTIRLVLSRLIQNGAVEKIVRNGVTLFRLTSKGLRDVEERFRLRESAKKWDGKWRIVLGPLAPVRSGTGPAGGVRLGFGKLRRGVYVSILPQKSFAVETATIAPFDNKTLAEKLWLLSVLAKDYDSWMKKAPFVQLGSVIAQYEAIVARDPFLPAALLPPGWPFERARGVFIKMLEDRFK